MKKYVRLNFREKDCQVIVIPDDNDLFCTTVDKAIKACKAYDEMTRCSEQFKTMLCEKLASWIKNHKDNIEQAFVTVTESGALFLVVRKSMKFDREFTYALADLDMKIAQDPELNLIKLSVLSLPHSSEEEYGTFLNPSSTFQYRRRSGAL